MNGFWDVVSRFREHLDASQRVLSPAFVPALRYLELYVNAFLRSYYLSCYFDLLQEFGLLPGNFSLSKVSCVLDQAMPKLLLDAMRELIRPQVLPGGYLLIPHPQSFINFTDYDPRSIVRNSVPLGEPDERLLPFGIMWFPRLAMCFRASWLTGTDDQGSALTFVEGTKREGLEPAKAAFVVRIFNEEQWGQQLLARKALAAKDAKKYDTPMFSEMQQDAKEVRLVAHLQKHSLPSSPALKVADYTKLRKVEEWVAAYDVSKLKGAVFASASTVVRDVELMHSREYYVHDFDAVEDAQRDFAMRILRPYIVYLADDVYRGRIYVVQDMFPDDIFFLGVDIYRGVLTYSIHQFQQEIIEKMDGDTSLEDRSFYLNRWIAKLSMSLKDWHFPSAHTPLSVDPVDGKSGVQIGQGRRARRSRRSPMPPVEQKAVVHQAPPVMVPAEQQPAPVLAAPAFRGRGRGRGRGYRRGRGS